MSEQPPGDDGTPAPAPPELRPLAPPELRPLALPMRRIVEVGLGLWALGLVLTLAVPALRDGQRSWWPWCCVAGLVLGGIGLVYLRRGRGNAAEA